MVRFFAVLSVLLISNLSALAETVTFKASDGET